MTDEVTLPRKLSEEPESSKEASKPVRPSHQKIIDQVERWANSPGLQPPQSQTSTTAKAG